MNLLTGEPGEKYRVINHRTENVQNAVADPDGVIRNGDGESFSPGAYSRIHEVNALSVLHGTVKINDTYIEADASVQELVEDIDEDLQSALGHANTHMSHDEVRPSAVMGFDDVEDAREVLDELDRRNWDAHQD